MHEVFPGLYFLGNLSDVAVYNQLPRRDLLRRVLPEGRPREQHDGRRGDGDGAVVVTNLDRWSPPEYVHMENVIDIEQCDELPTDPAVLDGMRARARETAAARGWDQLVEQAVIAYDYDAREKEAVTACNLCGATDFAELSRRDRYGYDATLLMCRRCGLGFLSPRLTAAEYGRFYEDVYRPLVSAYHGRRIDAETVQDDQRGYAAELVEFLRANCPRRRGR